VRKSVPASRGVVSWAAALPLETRALLIIAAVALVLRLWPIGGISTDYDEGVYWQSLRAMASGHPLFTSVFSSQPPLFLLALYPFYLLFGQTLLAARLAIVVYSLAGIIAIYYAGRALGGRWSGVLAALLLAVDPLYLAESHTLQAEVPALAFQLICVACTAEAMRRTGRSRRMLALIGGVALGLGIMVKLLDVVALVPATLFLAQPALAPFLGDDKRLRLPPWIAVRKGLRAALPDLALLGAGALGACALTLLPFVGSWNTLYDQVVTFHVVAGRAVDRGLRYNLTLLAKTGELYPLALLAAAALALALWRRAWAIAPIVLWLFASLVLLARQQPLFVHHRVLLSPELALIAALALPVLVASVAGGDKRSLSTPQRHNAMTIGFLALLALALVANLGLDARDNTQAAMPPSLNQAQLASALNQLTTPDDLVASDDQYVAGLADRTVLPQLVDTSLVRIQSGYLTADQLETLITKNDVRVILFASGRFDQIPGFRTWVAANFTQMATFEGHQALYLKKPPTPPVV
jgi:4-amino-4-deoxy-L-arabinose transferase-like glycosyltransferase